MCIIDSQNKKNIFPYFFSLKKEKGGAVLFYLGVCHSWDPADQQFNFIKEKWVKFLKLATNPLAIVESRKWKAYNTEAESILKGGEIDFMAYLCHQAGVPVICFEPDRGKEMDVLLRQFCKEEIAYYYFARTISQWYRLKQKPDINFYLSSFLQYHKGASKWDDFKFSIENMKKIHKHFFKIELDFDDINFFKKIENPMREDNPCKNVVRASRKYREQAIIDGIKNAWSQGKDPFVVYGKGHARDHEKILRDYQLLNL